MLNMIAFWSSIFWFVMLAIMAGRLIQNNEGFNQPISIQESGDLHEDRGCIKPLLLIDLFFFAASAATWYFTR